MNKSVIFSLLATLMFAACTSTPKTYIIEGVVPDDSYNNKMVYLLNVETDKRVDSAWVADGKFTFTGSVDTAVIRRLTLDRLFANLIIENGKISVSMAVQGKAKGTPLNDEMSKYEEECILQKNAYMEKETELRQKLNNDVETLNEQLHKNVQQTLTRYNSLHEKSFNANKNNILGAWILFNWTTLNSEKFDSLYMEAGDIVRNYKMLQKIFETHAKAKQTAEGMPFTDFTIENGNLDGSKASLSDYVGKGKYVLVDFWASWCGPCMAEIPVLVEVYNKYKGEKFDLLGVAVWDKREETLKSIESKNIAWSQIIDAGSIPTDLYGIRGIPHIILFAPDGTIVARDLRGDGLKTKVAEVMQ